MIRTSWRGWRVSRLACIALPLALLDGCALFNVVRQTRPVPVPGNSALELRVGAETRTYLLHVPERRRVRFGRALAYPLVIALHGSGAEGQTIRDMSHLDSLADRSAFLVAYPDATRNWLGLQSGWNAGACCGAAVRNDVDDIGFIRALIEHVASEIPVDRRRIYVAGFSDGGRMAYRLACTLSSEIAAIAVVAGSLVDSHCAPARPIPVIVFHGMADEEVSYADSSLSEATRPLVATPILVPPSVSFWAASNGCTGATATTVHDVRRVQFTGCAADVLFFGIEGGGHAWPGGAPDGDDGVVPAREPDASAEIVRFFLRHPRP